MSVARGLLSNIDGYQPTSV